MSLGMDIGDVVELDVCAENREWGYDPGPDGKRGVVIELSTRAHGRVYNYGRAPGIYENRAWARVRFEDGEESAGFINGCHLKTVKLGPNHREGWEGEKVSELPETSIWEGDIVRLPGLNDEIRKHFDLHPKHFDLHPLLVGAPLDHYVIDGIEWQWEVTEHGYSMRFSRDLGLGSHMLCGKYRTENTELIQRGWVWRWFHNEPIEYGSLEREAGFHSLLGLTEEVKNPRTENYAWTKEDCIAALKDNVAHGISVSNGLFGGGLQPSAVRFQDEDLGERIRQATLAGFS